MISPHGLVIETTSNDRGITFKLSGDLDMANSPRLLAQTNGHDRDVPLTVDLRDLSFLDSTGLGSLIKLKREHPAGVRLVRGPESVQKVFEITGCVPEFEWVEAAG